MPKIAPSTIRNRMQTPVIQWIRDKLLAVYRQRTTPPPGLPTPDGEARFIEMNRFPNTQSARTQSNPYLPGGLHHKASSNYYLARDARRQVEPPVRIYTTDGKSAVFKDLQGKTIAREDALKVEAAMNRNFGLETPIPGIGYEWKRNRMDELPTPMYLKDFADLERYDRYTHTT